jgi:hypothetical protein
MSIVLGNSDLWFGDISDVNLSSSFAGRRRD